MNTLVFKYKVLGAKRPLQISNIDLLSSCHTSFFVTFIQSILKDGGSITLIDPSPQGFPLILPLSLSYPATGCSGKIVVFLQEFSLFCHLSLSQTLGRYWLSRNWPNWPANGNDCTLALRWNLWKSLTAIGWRVMGCSENEKQKFPWTPCCVIPDTETAKKKLSR